MAGSKGILINLLEEDKTSARRRGYFLAGVIIAFILGGSMGYIYQSARVELVFQQKLNKELKTKLAVHEKNAILLQERLQLRDDLLLKQKSVKAVEQLQISHLDVLDEIEKAVPDKILLTNLEIKAGNAILEGYAPDYTDIARLLSGLRASSQFNKVKEASSELEENADEISFKIEMDWGSER